MIIFMSWEIIAFIILLILAVAGTSTALLSFLQIMLVISKILIVIIGFYQLILCLGSKRLIVTKIINTLTILFICYGLWWGCGSFKQELASAFNENILHYLGKLIGGGIEFMVFFLSGSMAAESMSNEECDSPHISFIGTMTFTFILDGIGAPMVNTIQGKLENIGSNVIIIILVLALVITVIQIISRSKKA